MEATSATYDGTRSFAEQYPDLEYYPLGTTEFVVSQAGFGCYRIDPRVHNHQLALRTALIHGINLIDTSTNYGDGGSEQLVGHMLGLLFAGGQMKRENVVIVSKVGYLQASNFKDSQARKARGEGWPELVEYGQGLEHCIHPDFLESQLSHSMDRLKVDCVDIYLLHNPEYYLGWARKQSMPLKKARATYYARIRKAFLHLEEEVKRGRIRYYGISSNSFPASAENPEFTSLTKIWEIAQSISAQHHFRIIQMPANLLETDAFTNPNQSSEQNAFDLASQLGAAQLPSDFFETGALVKSEQGSSQTVIELANELGLGVLINRPLNAVVGNALLRLADTPEFGTATSDEVEMHISALLAHEETFRNEIIHELPESDSAELRQRLLQYVAAGEMLHEKWFSLGTYHQWQQTVTSYLLPRLDAARNYLSQTGKLSDTGLKWLQSYVETVNLAFRAIGAVYATLANERNQTLRGRVEAAEPEWLANTLSQTALRALRTTRGASSVLVGMRHPDYVADVLEELSQPLGKTDHKQAWESLASE